MIVNYKSAKVTKPVAGVTRRILAHSTKVMLTEHTLEKGAILPDHKHPHEQLVYLISGEIIIEMNGKQTRVVKGDSFVIPSDVSHKVTTIENSVALDIFTPAREDYL
jgi:quercetin dioxygenase-like cupin family protein